MSTLRHVGAVALLGCVAMRAQSAPPNPSNATEAASEGKSSGADIVVEGRRTDERYRLPPEMRSLSHRSDKRAASIDPGLACHGVGPMGCGTKPIPILTVRGDGALSIGAQGDSTERFGR